MAGEMVPDVRTGVVLWASWKLTVAMFCRDEVFGMVDMVKLSSSEDSEDEEFAL